jgi:putative membrane-bound dehydrogenase-like protein
MVPIWVRRICSIGLMGCSTLWAEDSTPQPVEPYDTEGPAAQVLAPAEALRSLRIPEGFQATLFAAEPEIRQPIAATFDERGRLWVVECYTYAEGARNFDTRLRDRVLILEDTNGDGVHDRRKVFWDQGTKLTSVELGLGGVWVLGPPNLYFIPDRDRDDLPDGAPEIVLDGWKETGIRHNIANGLKWGPDGWLYGRQGILETSTIGPPGASSSQRVPINCGVWRYHPLERRVEAVLHGTTNPWGFDYDPDGEMFIINTVIGHLWHVVPGTHTERMYGADLNPHVYGLVEQVADHVHWDAGEPWFAIRKGTSDTTLAAGGGHAHAGLMIYQGDNWPAEDRGKVFAINFHGRRLNRDRLERHRSGFTARHEPDRVFWEDPWFRGIDLLSGPDGGVYVLDWSDTGECHDETGIHRSSGRIYKITFRSPKTIPPFDLHRAPLTELVSTIDHADKWWPRQARRVLRDRLALGENLDPVSATLKARLQSDGPVPSRLEALWMLEAIGQVDDAILDSIRRDPDERLRTWSVRLAAGRLEESRHLEEDASRETSPRVLLYLASALQRLPVEQRWGLAKSLAAKKEIEADRTLALMVWYGIEPAVATDPPRAFELFEVSRSSLLRRFIARRWTEELERDAAPIDRLLSQSADPTDVLAGMAEGMKGWSRAKAPSQWAPALERLSPARREELAGTLREMGIVFGDGRSMEELIALLPKEGQVDIRRQAIRTLGQSASPAALAAILPLILDREVQAEAVRALGSFDDPVIPERLLAGFPAMNESARDAAIDALASRPPFARALLKGIAEGKIPRRALSPFHARQMRSFGDAELTEQLAKVWGAVRPASETKTELMVRYREDILAPNKLASADRSRGRRVFDRQCASCHVLFGVGRKLGPDLTGSQRRSLDYLLENLLDPSALVAADFRASTVVMADGRSLQGVVTQTTDRTITLQTKDQDLVLDRREIDEVIATSQSLMPEGMLETLPADEARDLIAYLMAEHQVPIADP